MRMLILCTGNSCRSQMAEAIVKSLDHRIEVHSAGTYPAARVHPIAVRVMNEIDLDISNAKPKHVDEYLSQEFDYVITVCDRARETCPMFIGKVKHRVHQDFDDPTEFHGTDEEVLKEFRRVRDEIQEYFSNFIRNTISS